MIPIDPAVFLHPADYHAGGVSYFSIVTFVLGVGLFTFGAWQLARAAPPGPSTDRSAEDAAESTPDR